MILKVEKCALPARDLEASYWMMATKSHGVVISGVVVRRRETVSVVQGAPAVNARIPAPAPCSVRPAGEPSGMEGVHPSGG